MKRKIKENTMFVLAYPNEFIASLDDVELESLDYDQNLPIVQS